MAQIMPDSVVAVHGCWIESINGDRIRDIRIRSTKITRADCEGGMINQLLYEATTGTSTVGTLRGEMALAIQETIKNGYTETNHRACVMLAESMWLMDETARDRKRWATHVADAYRRIGDAMALLGATPGPQRPGIIRGG